MIISDIFKWYVHEHVNECLVYVTNMSSDDFGHGILTDFIKIILVLFFEYVVVEIPPRNK